MLKMINDTFGSATLSVRLAAGAALAVLIPAGTCVAQDSILVGDYNGSKIVRLAYPSGSAQQHFVGNGMTDMSGVVGMTIGPDGNLYFSSRLTHEIIRVDGRTGYPFGGTSVFVSASAGGLNQPTGLAFGPDGRLYVASYITDSVLVYDGTTGAFINGFVLSGSGSLDGPWAIAFNGGNLYVASTINGKVLRYNGTTGAFIDEVIPAGTAGLTQPRGILFDSSGRMYVTASITGGSAVLVKPPGGAVSVLASNTTIPGLSIPNLPALTGDGASLMVPCQNGTVQKIDRLSGSSQGTLVLNGAGGMSTLLESVMYFPAPVTCYPNCDNSVAPPILNVQDFSCFLTKFASGCGQ
jgi:DNA-binding beta-propeller fold protein YncE